VTVAPAEREETTRSWAGPGALDPHGELPSGSVPLVPHHHGEAHRGPHGGRARRVYDGIHHEIGQSHHLRPGLEAPSAVGVRIAHGDAEGKEARPQIRGGKAGIFGLKERSHSGHMGRSRRGSRERVVVGNPGGDVIGRGKVRLLPAVLRGPPGGIRLGRARGVVLPADRRHGKGGLHIRRRH
jgi:hypothetical protein